ncbi:CD276 antigen-like [Carcharodon carcharias]|uniref:CD276 antigen-like n=1 Tax=Carcharodon carcharias TaxID=13397 RepID=UPI001B7F436E|nr:CD276 antigen-like [Carcharodon carcharias]
MKNWIVGLHLAVSCVAAATGTPLILGIISERVLLPCRFNMSRGQNASDLHVLWQTAENQLVHAQLGESEWDTTQDLRYRNRTQVLVARISEGNLSLELDAVRPADEGLYSCIVLVLGDKGRSKEQETKVHLVAAAHFSRPVILGPQQEAIRPGEEVNLTCQSSGGYPKPLVNWTDAGGNLLPGQSQVDTTMQPDPVSGLWNVTSVLRVNVTVNSTFLCSIFNKSTRESRTARWKYSWNPDQSGKASALILVAVLIGVALAFTVGILLYRKKRLAFVYSVTSNHDNDLNLESLESRPSEMQKINQHEDCV